MSHFNDSSNSSKAPKQQNSKWYAIWRIYVIHVMSDDYVLYGLTKDGPKESKITNATNRYSEMDKKARSHIIFNV